MVAPVLVAALTLGQYGVGGFAGEPQVKAVKPSAVAAVRPSSAPVVLPAKPLPPTLTESQIRSIVQAEVAKALAGLSPCKCSGDLKSCRCGGTVQGCRVVEKATVGVRPEAPKPTAPAPAVAPASPAPPLRRILFFTAPSRCEPCRQMERDTVRSFTHPGYRLDTYSADDPASQATMAGYGITSLPSYVLLDAAERPVRVGSGYKGPAAFAAWVEGR